MSIRFIFFIIVASLCLQSCASHRMSQELQQGKKSFDAGDYKQSFHTLLPAASNGDPEAQYAVGYMYYYGYGVPQDSESGLFWMHKAADQRYEPAMKALSLIEARH